MGLDLSVEMSPVQTQATQTEREVDVLSEPETEILSDTLELSDIYVSNFSWCTYLSSITIEQALSIHSYGKALIKRSVERREPSSGPAPYPLVVVERKYKEHAYEISRAYIDFPMYAKLTTNFVVGGYVYPQSIVHIGFCKSGPSEIIAEAPMICSYWVNYYFTKRPEPCEDPRILTIREAFKKAESQSYREYAIYSHYLVTAIINPIMRHLAATTLVPSDSDVGVLPDYIEFVKTLRRQMSDYPEHARHYGTAIALLQRIA